MSVTRKPIRKRPQTTDRRPPAREIHFHLTIDIGAHLSHLFKRLFPKNNGQREIDQLTGELKESGENLKRAVDAQK